MSAPPSTAGASCPGCSCRDTIARLQAALAGIEADIREIDEINAEKCRRETALASRIAALEARSVPFTVYPNVGAAGPAPFTIYGVGAAGGPAIFGKP